MSQYIKVTFRSKPKIFNEKTLFKIFLIRQLIANDFNVFKELKEDKENSVQEEWKTYKYRFNSKYTKEDYKKGCLPYLVSQRNPRMTNILYSMLYNY